MTRLYKYLDVTGGLAMLEHHNLQFTNAFKFNDPFDCHPALFDYSHAPVHKNNWPPADFLSMKGENNMENLRNSTWMCCLSKVYDSLLMWAYYVPQGQVTDMLMLMVGHNRVRPLCALPFEKT